MMKMSMQDFLKLGILLVAIYLIYALVFKREGMEDTKLQMPAQPQVNVPVPAANLAGDQFAPSYVGIDETNEKLRAQYINGPNMPSPADLLPPNPDAASYAANTSPDQLLASQNFLVSGYNLGVNSVQQVNKIPNYDIRSAPPIPKLSVNSNLFHNSEYDTPMGFGQRKLEVGN